MDKYYLAVDIGASSGRHMLASMKDGKMQLEEVYRFPNGMTEKNGTLCWDVERLFTEIKNGLKVCKELGKIPVSMAIDTWAVDYVLLDEMTRFWGIQQVTETAVQMEWMKRCMKRFRWELCMQEPESRNRFSTRSIS